MDTLQIKTILCAVDFSDMTRKVLTYARSLAEKFDAKIVLLHVIEPFLTSAYVTFDTSLGAQVQETMEEKADDLMDELAREADWDNLEKKISLGRAYQEIVEEAQKSGADLIVMGTHGFTGLTHFLIGSNAEKVVRKASCPVLTVKGEVDG